MPDATVAVIMGGVSNADCIIDGSEECLSFDGRGYTGNMHIAATNIAYITVYGDAFLDSNMGTPDTFHLVFKDDATLDTGGFPSVAIYAKTIDKTLSILSDVAGCIIQTANNHIVNLAAVKTMTYNDASLADTAPIEWNSSEAMVFGAGAKIVLNCTYGVSVNGSGALLCPVEAGAASSTITIAGSGFSFQSYTQAGGTLGAAGLLTTVGDFTVTGGGLSSVNITVGGNYLISDATMVTVVADVTGTAVAHDTEITSSDFSAGTDLNALDNCVDNGGNDASILFPVTYGTWNPGEAGGASLSNGNLTATFSTTLNPCKAIPAIPRSDTGVYAIAGTFTGSDNEFFIGQINSDVAISNNELGAFGSCVCFVNQAAGSGRVFRNGSVFTFGAAVPSAVSGMPFHLIINMATAELTLVLDSDIPGAYTAPFGGATASIQIACSPYTTGGAGGVCAMNFGQSADPAPLVTAAFSATFGLPS